MKNSAPPLKQNQNRKFVARAREICILEMMQFVIISDYTYVYCSRHLINCSSLVIIISIIHCYKKHKKKLNSMLATPT